MNRLETNPKTVDFRRSRRGRHRWRRGEMKDRGPRKGTMETIIQGGIPSKGIKPPVPIVIRPWVKPKPAPAGELVLAPNGRDLIWRPY